MLVISAIPVLAILVLKELVSAGKHKKSLVNLLYIPALPPLIFFGIAAYEKISRMPNFYT